MSLESQPASSPTPESWDFAEPPEFAEPPLPQTIDLLPPLETPGDLPALEIAAELPAAIAGESATPSWQLPTTMELQPARLRVGLFFVGSGAISLTLLWLYIKWVCPEFGPAEQMTYYWQPYLWFVGLGVAGLFMLGREVMRGRGENEG